MRESLPCRPCHAPVFDSYARTGMGRSFTPAALATWDEFWKGTRFYHAPSARYYEMKLVDGRPVQRRWQLDSAGRETNIFELEVHFVIGSGNHSRTYAHRNPSGKLIELPVSWYSEDGGHFAMSPGYDRPRHSDFQREVSGSCLFCHNGYPRGPELAHGIDCSRCHPAGGSHFVNPAKLSLDRQTEVCLQCHLESASRSLPDAIRRFDQDPFSYRAGEPLGSFQIYFDRAVEGGGFTVNHSAYGLRQSRCFLESKGRLTCLTCHDPHRRTHAADADRACRGCHAAAHPEKASGCAECHMPKRRAEDAVHVVMTDHRIRRAPETNLLDPIAERHGRYDGPVRLLYPPRLPDTAESRLYEATAALTDSVRLAVNAAALERLIETAKPRVAGFDLALGAALQSLGRTAGAERHYRRAVTLEPGNAAARLKLAELSIARGLNREAVKLVEDLPPDSAALNTLAIALTGLGRYEAALQALDQAAALDPPLAITWLNKSVALRALGRLEESAAARRNAIRLDPDLGRR